MPKKAKKNLSQKINKWRTGQTLYSVGRLIGKYSNKHQAGTLPIPRPKEFVPKLSARIFNLICKFWSNHWQWILGLSITSIIGIIGLYLLWLQLKIPK